MDDDQDLQKIPGAGLTAVRGISASGVSCGLKKGKKDLALIYSASQAVAAGVFTRNLVKAAPILLCQENIHQPVQAIVVNSGNANACTGELGLSNARQTASLTARALNLQPEQILVCSTGVIGQQLPMEKIENGVAAAAAALVANHEGALNAAEAILTTDKVIKQATYRGTLAQGSFHLAGIAKGSGMICPDMATMLAFLVTDVRISRSLLGRLFKQAVNSSFNLITVDGDTSTNDTALILANSALPDFEVVEGTPSCDLFYKALETVCGELAYAIIADAEGATKVIKLTIKGARDRFSARIMAHAVLNSPLVKTAFFGEDANWGRILSALGRAGAPFDPRKADIYLGPVQVASGGQWFPFDEGEARQVLQQKEVAVLVDLHDGEAELTAWGTDLSHEYVSINSHYRS